MAAPVSLDSLIASVRATAPDEPLAQLEEAARVKGEVDDLSDALLGHFVDQARRAGCSWSQIGEALGVSKQAAQQRHSARIPADRLTPRTQLALERGLAAAQARGAGEAGPEHLLLGILAVPECLAARLLDEAGLTAPVVEAALPPVVADGGGDRLPGYSSTAVRVLSASLEQALRLGHNYIGTEHVLLSLGAEPEGPVAGWLAERGLTHEALRARVQEVLRGLT